METTLNVGYTTRVPLARGEMLVVTSGVSGDACAMITRVSEGGAVVAEFHHECGPGADAMNASQMEALARRFHFSVLKDVQEGRIRHARSAADYHAEAQGMLRRNKPRDAARVVAEARRFHPEDAMLASLAGLMTAMVERQYRAAVDLCVYAVGQAERPPVPGASPIDRAALYLNLSRVYLVSGDKRRAVESLKQGVAHDSPDGAIEREMVKLGIRQTPVLPFLTRSNPVNKVLGKIRHSISRADQ